MCNFISTIQRKNRDFRYLTQLKGKNDFAPSIVGVYSEKILYQSVYNSSVRYRRRDSITDQGNLIDTWYICIRHEPAGTASPNLAI